MDATPAQLKILENNLRRVRERIAAACARVRRDPKDVKLIAVTKSVGPEIVQALIELGVKNIGENRLQDAQAKFREVAALHNRKPGEDDLHTHFIGHLQTNKVKHVLKLFDTIHSVDSVELAQEINKRAKQAGRVVQCFVELNVSQEDSKEGMTIEEADKAIVSLVPLLNIEWIGLMAMAPLQADQATVRRVFGDLRDCATVRFNSSFAVRLESLSMGMSNDFEIAIEEGATHVRIGTALFEGLVP
jgi:pyridoxal phosphate enzyme (YggS family)